MKGASLRDVVEHQRIYPRHSIHWFDGVPFYCTGDHDPGEAHDWRPVPKYTEGERCEQCEK